MIVADFGEKIDNNTALVIQPTYSTTVVIIKQGVVITWVVIMEM